MKAIRTRYIGPGNVRGARIVAEDGDNRIYLPYPHESSNPHRDAAVAFCAKLNWHGELVEGGTKDGSVFVFVDGQERIKV